VKEPLSLILGFVNNGDSPLNISGLIGTLTDPFVGRNVYNITGVSVGEVVEPGSEMSLVYKFTVPGVIVPDFPARLQVSASVYYEDDAGTMYANTFFNETVKFTTAPYTTKWFFDQAASSGAFLIALVTILALAVPSVPAFASRSGAMAAPKVEEVAAAPAAAAVSTTEAEEDMPSLVDKPHKRTPKRTAVAAGRTVL